MILKKLQLINFKCFSNHIINFNNTTIIIGENNAGKSTVVEALRLLGLACARLKSIAVYINRPNWLTEKPVKTKGVNISSKVIDIELECVFNQLNDPPAIVIAFFDNDLILEINIHSEKEIFAFSSIHGNNLTSREKFAKSGIPDIFVLPQIVPLRKDEEEHKEKTIFNNRFSKRASGSFRNSLYLKQKTKEFSDFENIIEKTWGSIKINEIYKDGNILRLQLRDRDFATEIFNMGHGVQMWLQTMWFISCVGEKAIVVLDEPDVYMHADLQRKLIRLLKDRYNQTIIATHSIEIMAEVQPSNILIVNRNNAQSVFADEYPVLQTAISKMGSIHNIALSRILNNKKYLFVEGDDDKEILKILYDKLFPYTSLPLDHIPTVSTHGWGSWDLQKNIARSMIEEMKELNVYFLYDRDYHTEKEIEERKAEAISKKINLFIWNKKEIENYLIVPTTISRFIYEKNQTKELKLLNDQITTMINGICEDIEEYTLDNLIQEESKRVHHKKEYSTIKAQIRPEFKKKWETFDGRIELVSGDMLINKLSDKCKNIYGVSFGSKQIASCMMVNEISDDIKNFLSAINKGKEYSKYDE